MKFSVFCIAVFATAGTTTAQTFSEDDVAAHSANNDCWTIVDDKVYDITSYAPGHTGGDVIYGMCGIDGTAMFNTEHQGSGYMDIFTTFKGDFAAAGPNPTPGPNPAPGPAPAPAPAPAPGPSQSTDENSSGGGGGFCFSETATVEVAGKGIVTMKDLQVGDKVLVGNSSDNAKSKYETVYAFAHREPTKIANFLQIFTNKKNQEPLEMTGEHLVFLKGQRNPVRADSIHMGDVLAPNHVVTKIKSKDLQGLYAPLTPSGTIVVNGIQASSYISLQKQGTEYINLEGGVKTVAQQDLIHWSLTPFRMTCMSGMPFLNNFCEPNDTTGMPPFVSNGLAFAHWLDALNMPLWLQMPLLVAFVVVVGTLAMLEYTVGMLFTYGVPAMAFGGMTAAIFTKAGFDIGISDGNKIKTI